MQHGDAIGERADHVHVVLDDEQRHLARQPLEHAGHPLGLLRRHARGRLVEEEEFGTRGQGHADLELTLLAVGERARRRREPVPQADRLRRLRRALEGRAQSIHPPEEAPASPPVCGRGEAQILEHRQLGKEVGALEGAGDAAPGDRVRRQACDEPALEEHVPGAGRHLACDDVEERGLAGAVGADDGVPRLRRHAERHAGEGRQRAEGARERRDGEERRRGHERIPTRPRRAPTTPPGAKSTSRMKVRPRISIQRSV